VSEDATGSGLVSRFRAWAARVGPKVSHQEALLLLFDMAREDLQLARLAEAHLDALIIGGEAGRLVDATSTFGVWASDGPESRLVAAPGNDNRWTIEGRKQYCTGAGIVTDALVTAHAPGGLRLVHLDVRTSGSRADLSTWRTSAFAETHTGAVAFSESLDADRLVGAPNWYLERPGFWLGAIRVAACWAGGAVGLVDALAARHPPRDAHRLAHMGTLDAISWELRLLVRLAATGALETDRPEVDAARIRLLVAERCHEVLTRVARAGGPAVLALDGPMAAHYAQLQLYIRQHHAERDAERLGRLVGDVQRSA
jgi:hypothetical protein